MHSAGLCTRTLYVCVRVLLYKSAPRSTPAASAGPEAVNIIVLTTQAARLSRYVLLLLIFFFRSRVRLSFILYSLSLSCKGGISLYVSQLRVDVCARVSIESVLLPSRR